MSPASSPPPLDAGRLAAALLLGLLLLLGYRVLRDFLVPLLWAAILTYLTWPAYQRLRGYLGERRNAAALLMTVLLCVVIVLPVLGLTASLRGEVEALLDWLRAAHQGEAAPQPRWLVQIPWVGERLARFIERVAQEPELLGDWLAGRSGNWIGEAADVLGAVGRNAVKFGLSLLTVFFFYRDGERLLTQARTALRALAGPAADTYWSATAGMTWAVVYGLILTALAQGFLAGLGYAGAGVEAPVLLGVLTALFALIPFGAPAVWGSTALWLLWSGQWWAGIGLALWGALVVSFVDNLIRPLVISSTSRIPFLLVLFGVLGGLRAFGLVGLFLGPIVLAVLLAMWRQWLSAAPTGEGRQAPGT